MNVLSLFDGMSCGQIALNRLGLKIDNYYASEVDGYAIEITQKNYPNTVQLGDVSKLDIDALPKIDLLLAGSPCQGFSFAGKQLAFDDPRSALFFEFVKILKKLKPKYFLLENVRMKKEYLNIITEHVSECYPEIPFGIEPILINSSLVSAQNRNRYYWTNIPNIKMPEERGIVLKDILEDQVDPEHYAGEGLQKKYAGGSQLNPDYKSQANTIHDREAKSGTICAGTHGYANGYIMDKHKPVKKTERNARHLRDLDQKSLCMTATMWKGAGNNGMTLVPQHIGTAVDINGHDNLKRVYSQEGKSPTLTTCGGGNREPKVLAQSYREVRTEEARELRRKVRKETGKDFTPFRAKELVPREDGKVGTITPGLNNDHRISLTRDSDQAVYWRKLTPLECERLQTVPDNYTEGVSNTRRYQMLGNGWTVEVICHILKNMEL
jgi:DNA-cytosine methyltransferase